MKNTILGILLVLSATAAHACYTVKATALKFVATNGSDHCNGIKVYDGQTVLFNLGCPHSENDFADHDFNHISYIANDLNDFVRVAVSATPPETDLIVCRSFWDENDPEKFISIYLPPAPKSPVINSHLQTMQLN